MSGWRLSQRTIEALPPLAWAARLRWPDIEVRAGSGVSAHAGWSFEGTFAGACSGEGLLASTTVFGSGVVAAGDRAILVPPSHSMEGIYVARRGDAVFAANTLVGLLSSAGLDLVRDAPYPHRFRAVTEGLAAMPARIPTDAGDVELWFFENIAFDAGNEPAVLPKPREEPFGSYADYRTRIAAALAACIDNAPGYEPVVALSSGYDSTAMAALAAGAGGRRAVSIALGKAGRGERRPPDDSGRGAARALGLDHEVFERHAYAAGAGHPEAEFLATGFSGEDVVLAPMERSLRRTMLISGHLGDAVYRFDKPLRPDIARGDVSGCSLSEFRVRVGFINVPLPSFGMTARASLRPINSQPEMAPWRLGTGYDRPIPRRMIEEAGVPRGAFAVSKRAASGALHSAGLAEMSAATATALRDRAAREGIRLRFGRDRLSWRHRAVLRLAKAVHAQRLEHRLERRRQRSHHFEPATGNLILRWAVDQVRPRYASIEGWPTD